ncbi:UNKNOWN [Stylonychia lemnae]|uniref:Uncharacterized protein n=1 Tax=Stylonychia lemnae TaxID=5949 RepID=A0A077ZVX7_STYLE|nr:UNKNOWN [Stylonychia lemnae]|eukprot:CDW74105.1 UNKNOWN [Stylonychia lemnae]
MLGPQDQLQDGLKQQQLKYQSLKKPHKYFRQIFSACNQSQYRLDQLDLRYQPIDHIYVKMSQFIKDLIDIQEQSKIDEKIPKPNQLYIIICDYKQKIKDQQIVKDQQNDDIQIDKQISKETQVQQQVAFTDVDLIYKLLKSKFNFIFLLPEQPHDDDYVIFIVDLFSK